MSSHQSPIPDSSGWQASLSLGYQARGPRTVLAHRRRSGPLTIQRAFYPEGPVCHSYLLHPPGGIVGGDQLQIDVQVESGAHALIATPGAAKFYRSAGATAIVQQRITVEAGASLEWLPQENILFPGAEVQMKTRIDLAAGSRFFGWEIHCLGRPVIAERFSHGRADLGLEIWTEGRPLLVERLRLFDEHDLNGAAGLRGKAVIATLIAGGADAGVLAIAQRYLEQCSDGNHAAATRLDDLLVVRFLGDDTNNTLTLLRGLWMLLRPQIIGLQASPPRIWAT
jgi:urease accessory protein